MKNDLPNLSKKLSHVYGYEVRLVGPYKCKDGRKRVDIKGGADSPLNKTVLLARVRLEIKIGRPLEKDETVDHVNGVKTDDSYGNVQLLSRAENARKAVDKIVPPKVRCAWCQKKFQLTKEQSKPSLRKAAGPFCSRSCRGKYGKRVQVTKEVSKRTEFKVKRIRGA